MEHLRSKQDIITEDLAPDDAADLESSMRYAAEYHELIASLPPIAQQAIIEMGTAYLDANNFTYFKKLFKNAIPYVTQGRITQIEDGFLVEGNTNGHFVAASGEEGVVCDCDLFNGWGKFADRGGACSHLQAVELLLLIEAHADKLEDSGS